MLRFLVKILVAVWPAVVWAQNAPLADATWRLNSDQQLRVDHQFRFPTVDVASTDLPVQRAAEQSSTTQQSQELTAGIKVLRPAARSEPLPRTRWEHMKGHQQWTRSAIAALKSHGKPLVTLVPGDIADWCPAYPTASDTDRRAFWVGFMSALAKHESTYKPWAVGGGGKWFGLLQILPGTARGYKCTARSGGALKNGGANLSCAIRIMARTVVRDGVIHGYKNGKGRGVTADWGPMHSASKRRDMAGWLRQQNYCKPIEATRPKLRNLADDH